MAAQQPAAASAPQVSEAAKPTTPTAPQQGAGLSQAPQQATPVAQTHNTPPPAQQAPPPAPAAQAIQSSATTPMSPGIKESAMPLHQQPASTGYQAPPAAPSAPTAPPVGGGPGGGAGWRPGDLARPDQGAHTGLQGAGNPYAIPTRTPIFPWQDQDRSPKNGMAWGDRDARQQYLTAQDTGVSWWGDAVQYFLTGWLLRGHESEQGKLAFAPLLEPAQEGQMLRRLADGMPSLEWSFVFGEHATEGPKWFWFTNQGPMLAPLRGKGVPSAARGSLESWPSGDYLQGLSVFGRSRTAAEAAVLFAEGMLQSGALTQVRAVVTTEELGAELRNRALGVNTSARAASGRGHLDNTVVLDLTAARALVPGFADGKPAVSALQLTHPLASANPALFLRLERLASLWTDKGEAAPAGLPIPVWRMAGLAHLATRWVLMALGHAPGNWAGEQTGWTPIVSTIRDTLNATDPWQPPKPDLSSNLAAFDHAAQGFAVMTLRESTAWLIGDLNSVNPKMRNVLAGQLEDPLQREFHLGSIAANTFDNAWKVVIGWEATRLAVSHIWGAGGPDANTQWLYDLGYLMHKLCNGDLRNPRHPAFDAQGALDRFETWAKSFDRYNPKPMPNLV